MSGDIHNLEYSERMNFLNGLSNSKHIVKAETIIVDNASDLRKAVMSVSSQEGSEGAYLKREDFRYELDGKTQANIKFKNSYSIDAQVQEIHKVKGAESWNYLCTIKTNKGRDVPIGRTYNTSIKLKKGEIVKVEFVNLNKYFDVKLRREWYNWWSPRVIMAREDKKEPDSTATADRLVEASHGETKNRRASVSLDGDPYMTVPDEGKKRIGMVHVHGRGKSIHLDLRFEVTSDWAVGWTLYIPKGLSKVPGSFSEFKKLVDKEITPIIKEKLVDPKLKFNCGTKLVEPVEWLDYQGMVQKGEVGATKNEPGFFYIIDRFEVDFGAQKPHFHEYFCHGDLFDGRFCIRLLENKADWKKTDEGLMTWMASIALTDKTPYVLSKRAADKNWVPPFDRSALPQKVKKQIPEEDQYWRHKDPNKRREVRDALLEKIKKRAQELNLDGLGPAMYSVLRQTFKKQTVIREGPTRTRYFFVVSQNDIGKFSMAMLENPLENEELTGILVKLSMELSRYRGGENAVKPGTSLNQTKATPSNMEVLEHGKAVILSNRNLKRYKFKGEGKMKGEWIAYRTEEGSALWILKKKTDEN